PLRGARRPCAWVRVDSLRTAGRKRFTGRRSFVGAVWGQTGSTAPGPVGRVWVQADGLATGGAGFSPPPARAPSNRRSVSAEWPARSPNLTRHVRRPERTAFF